MRDFPCSASAFAALSRELLQSGTSVRFRARGGSMAPLIRDGDILLVRPLASGEGRVGDVVIVSDPAGHLVVHRVICRQYGPEGTAFTVQGDQVLRADGVFLAEGVYGKVVAVERGGQQIRLDEPAMRLLGRLAALRSRWRVGRGGLMAPVRRAVKKLPVLSRYLA